MRAIVVGDQLGLVQRFQKTARLPFPILIDSGAWTFRLFPPDWMPLFTLVDNDGTILAIFPRGRDFMSDTTSEVALDRLLVRLERVVGSSLQCSGRVRGC